MVKTKEKLTLKAKWIFHDVEDDGNDCDICGAKAGMPHENYCRKLSNKRIVDNIMVTVGKVAVARNIGGAGVKANEGQITYIAGGTNGATPVVGNTTLGTELTRKTTTYAGLTGTQVSIRAYWTKSEGIGTWLEAGAFGEDAGAGADSGTMFNHVNVNVVKDATKGLQVEILITVS